MPVKKRKPARKVGGRRKKTTNRRRQSGGCMYEKQCMNKLSGCPDAQKLARKYGRQYGSGFFKKLWSGIKSIAKPVGQAALGIVKTVAGDFISSGGVSRQLENRGFGRLARGARFGEEVFRQQRGRGKPKMGQRGGRIDAATMIGHPLSAVPATVVH